MALLVDGGDPVAKWEAMVAGEGEEVAGHGGEVGDVAADEEEDDYYQDDGHPGGGHGLAEDIDGGVESGVCEGGWDVRDVVDDGQDGGEDKAEVDEVDGHHGFWDGFCGVFDFF